MIGNGLELDAFTVFITTLHPTEAKKKQTLASLLMVTAFYKLPRIKNALVASETLKRKKYDLLLEQVNCI